MAFEALLATERLGDRTLVGGLGRLEPLAFDQKLDDRRRHLGQLAARAQATPICPLLLGPALTAGRRTLKHHSAARCCSRTTMADLNDVKRCNREAPISSATPFRSTRLRLCEPMTAICSSPIQSMRMLKQIGSQLRLFVFFFNDPAPTEIYTLSLHDALPTRPCR